MIDRASYQCSKIYLDLAIDMQEGWEGGTTLKGKRPQGSGIPRLSQVPSICFIESKNHRITEVGKDH